MKKILLFFCVVPYLCLVISGCVPLVIGAAAGALGGYAVSKDTVEGDTDKPFESLWDAAVLVSKNRGTVIQENQAAGYIELMVAKSRVTIRLLRLTRSANRIKVSGRKYHLPDLSLAQDIFVKIMEQAQ